MAAILITGANGFIGRHLADALARDGHEVVCALRDPERMHDRRFRTVAADFIADVDAAAWMPRLAGIDVVINAVGILREHHAQTFDAIHSRAPRALFAACVQAGVKRVVQVSALGADRQAVSRYHLSKKEADDYLATLPLQSVIVQPSLIYGPGGTSARLFTLLASLPLIPLPGAGRQQVQPVHIDDLVAAMRVLVERDASPGTYLPVVGPEAISLRTFLARLREAMGGGRAHFLPVPLGLMRIGARAGNASRAYAAVHAGSRIERATPHGLVKILFDELLLSFDAAILSQEQGDMAKASEKRLALSSQTSRLFFSCSAQRPLRPII